jgi:hypothetical protein
MVQCKGMSKPMGMFYGVFVGMFLASVLLITVLALGYQARHESDTYNECVAKYYDSSLNKAQQDSVIYLCDVCRKTNKEVVLDGAVIKCKEN